MDDKAVQRINSLKTTRRGSHLQRSFVVSIACTVVLFLEGCSTVQVASGILDTASLFGKKREAESSFLAAATGIFYPDGIPRNVSNLPTISDENVSAIQSQLDIQADLLLRTVEQSKSFLESLIGRSIVLPQAQRFSIKRLNSPTVFLSNNNEIVIDVKVVQGIFRGSLVSAVNKDDLQPMCVDPHNSECQGAALRKVFSARAEFLRQADVPAFSQVAMTWDIFSKAARNGLSGAVAGLDDGMDRAVELWSAEKESTQASRHFDDAVMFIVAHEFGHRVLQHYQRLQSGENQYDLELEADRFAAIASVLARNVNARIELPSLIQQSGRWYSRTKSGMWCDMEINHKPTGVEDYFSFGYPFSGFDDAGPGYPDRALRLKATEGIAEVAVSAIYSAQNQKGHCDSPGVPNSLEEFIAKRERRYRDELDESKARLVKLVSAKADLRRMEQELVKAGKIPLDEPEYRAVKQVIYSLERSGPNEENLPVDIRKNEFYVNEFNVWRAFYLEFMRRL